MCIIDQQESRGSAKLESTLGNRLDQLISHLKMNQGEFARSLDCSPTFISEIVRDIKKPGADFLTRIATKFDVSLDWLLCGRDVNTDSGMINSKINLDRLKFIAFRVELAVQARKGDDCAELLLNQMLTRESELTSSINAQTKKHLSEQIDTYKFVGSLYNQMTDVRDLNALSELVLKASIERYGLNKDDILEKLIIS